MLVPEAGSHRKIGFVPDQQRVIPKVSTFQGRRQVGHHSPIDEDQNMTTRLQQSVPLQSALSHEPEKALGGETITSEPPTGFGCRHPVPLSFPRFLTGSAAIRRVRYDCIQNLRRQVLHLYQTVSFDHLIKKTFIPLLHKKQKALGCTECLLTYV